MAKAQPKTKEEARRKRNPDPSPEILGIPRRITFMRKERGLGLNKLADKAGIASSVLSRLEAGETVANVSAETVFRIAGALDVSVEWLVTGRHPRIGAVG
jgi:DNA-binding Xre family transcriptional regulator